MEPMDPCQETDFMRHLRLVAQEVEQWPDWMRGEYVNVVVPKSTRGAGAVRTQPSDMEAVL